MASRLNWTGVVGRPLALAGLPVLAVLVALVCPGQRAEAASDASTYADQLHRVQPGDTLIRIARRYSVSVPALVRANRLANPRSRLRVGAELAIPSVKRAVARSAVSASRPRNASPATPRVRRASLIATTPAAPANLALDVPEFVDLPPGFVWPVDGMVSSSFGRRGRAWHRGIDIMAPPGTVIIAAAPGIVVTSGVEDRYGRVVKIAHDNGFVTVYAHNDQNLVELGDTVAAEQKIALVGRTGHATSEHVHFEIRHEGRAYNPLYLLPLPPRLARVEEREPDETDSDE
jgi:murein DD-endopeptidase MepM/ murein hydrolase activator NlpD